MEITIKRKDVLLELIKKHNQLYRSGVPEIPDLEYDTLVNELKEIDPGNEWFTHIEPAAINISRKVKLPIPMKSLDKVKNLSEIDKWVKSLGLSNNSFVVCMPKFDGVSLLCNEITRMAYSRGGSDNEGQDCSKHINKAKIVTSDQFSYTYGEFLINNRSWADHFKGCISKSTGEPYKSPRNTAAGMINSDEPSDLIGKACFFRYGVSEYDLKSYDTFTLLIKSLCTIYNQEHLYQRMPISSLDEKILQNMFFDWKTMYPIDGVVIYIDDLSIWEKTGRHASTGNPLYAIAYKHPDFTDSFETTVENVVWKVSKAGALKPVVNIKPVDTGDCEMKSPTGYNASWIDDMEIAPGAKVLVTRSGGVIPKILSTLVPANLEIQHKMWDDISECPCCGFPTTWNENYVELCCTNPDCGGVKLAKIVHFFTVCGAEEMGEESYAKLFVSGFDTIKKILNITPEDILDIDGFGESTVDIILNNNQKIASGLDMATIMHASDCFDGIGKIKAQKILDEMAADNDILSSFYNGEFLGPTDEFLNGQSKTMQSFYSGVVPFYKFIANNNITILQPTMKSINDNGVCKGMVVCFSGVRDKNLEDKINSEGGKVSGGVSKNTTILVVKDTSDRTSKIEKAKSLGVKVINIDDFRYMING